MEEPAVRGCPGSVEPIGLLTVLKELKEPAGARSLGAAKDCTRCGLLEESLVGAVATDSDFFGEGGLLEESLVGAVATDSDFFGGGSP